MKSRLTPFGRQLNVRSERILVALKPNYLGDTVCATPLLRRISEEFSQPVVLGSKLARELLKNDSSNLIIRDQMRSRSPLVLFKSAAELRKERFDVVLIVNRSIRAALMMKVAGIKTRVGIVAEGRGFLLTHRVPHDDDRPEAEAYGDLARAIGLEGSYEKVQLTVDAAEKKRGSELLKGAMIGIHPGASHAVKQIPAKVVAPVLYELHGLGFPLAMFGGKGEELPGTMLQDELQNPALNLIGKCSLRESLGALSQLKLMIGGSSGVMHMAVAAGAPTLGVFGPHNSKRWGHNFAPHQTIQIPSSVMGDLDAKQFRDSCFRMLGIA